MFFTALNDSRRSAMLLGVQLKTVSSYFASINIEKTTARRICSLGIDAHFLFTRRQYESHRSGTIQISFDGSSVARRHDLCLFIVSTQVSDDEGAYLPTMALPQVLKLLWTYKYSINSIVLRLEHESYIFF